MVLAHLAFPFVRSSRNTPTTTHHSSRLSRFVLQNQFIQVTLWRWRCGKKETGFTSEHWLLTRTLKSYQVTFHNCLNGNDTVERFCFNPKQIHWQVLHTNWFFVINSRPFTTVTKSKLLIVIRSLCGLIQRKEINEGTRNRFAVID